MGNNCVFSKGCSSPTQVRSPQVEVKINKDQNMRQSLDRNKINQGRNPQQRRKYSFKYTKSAILDEDTSKINKTIANSIDWMNQDGIQNLKPNVLSSPVNRVYEKIKAQKYK